ncbi:MAG: glycosyltransferase family A protein [Rhodospirillaceae bacterium]|nr:glycosyltransferase family A protein [Rhodospirillaceae bacterium]
MAVAKKNKDTVTVCVPAFRAASFVGETLTHIAAQTHDNLRILVSVDLSDDDTAAHCRRFASDPRFDIVVQAKRRGWIDNINSLIERVETDDYCIVPHDDLIEPGYVAALRATLDRRPKAVVAYTDIEAFGALKGWASQKPIVGTLFDRVAKFLTEHFDAVAFRGLVRRSRAGNDLAMKSNQFNGYAADTLWMLQVLQHGNLVRVRSEPGHGYLKRYHVGSQHHAWLKWTIQRRLAAWIEHCGQCAELALAMPFNDAERAFIVQATLMRGIKRFKNMGWPPHHDDLSEAHRAMVTGLLATRIAGLRVPPGTISKLRELPQYAAMTHSVWGEADVQNLKTQYSKRVRSPDSD